MENDDINKNFEIFIKDSNTNFDSEYEFRKSRTNAKNRIYNIITKQNNNLKKLIFRLGYSVLMIVFILFLTFVIISDKSAFSPNTMNDSDISEDNQVIEKIDENKKNESSIAQENKEDTDQISDPDRSNLQDESMTAISIELNNTLEQVDNQLELIAQLDSFDDDIDDLVF